MAAIYCLSAFIFFYYFLIGYKKFKTAGEGIAGPGLIAAAVILRLFYLKLGNMTFISCINIAADLITGYLIYRMALKHYDIRRSLLAASFYLLNPVVLIYSCVWGNMVAYWMLLTALCIYFLSEKKVEAASLTFCVSLYCYIGNIFLLPVFLRRVIQLVKGSHSKKCALAAVFTAMLSFGGMIGIDKLFRGSSYFLNAFIQLLLPDRIARNACNIWGFIGWNWREIPQGLEKLKMIEMIIMIGIYLVLILFYLEDKWQDRRLCYLYIAFVSAFSGFLFAIGMNEYMFASVIILSFFCFLFSGCRQAYIIYVGLSILHFFNQVYTCSIYNAAEFNTEDPWMIITSFLILAAFVLIFVWLRKDEEAFRLYEGEEAIEEEQGKVHRADSGIEDRRERKSGRLERGDILSMAGLTLIFAALSFPTLGSHQAPQTTYEMTKDTSHEVIVDLGEEKEVDHLSFFLGRQHERKVSISSYNEAEKKWDIIAEDQNIQSVFAWNDIDVKQPLRYLGIVCSDEEAYFNELAIVGGDGSLIMPVDAYKYSALFDEQKLYKPYPTYYDQTFFDEVYHARTAYEYIHHYIAYENTHPPLGKILISLGIRAFGMNPFGWRIVVECFGILMVPLIYIFAKRLFKEQFTATLTTLLLTMDFMHFTLSKIATLDIIIGFFILLMYYWMYRYCTLDFERVSLKEGFVPLGLCGITMGIGIAVKWTGVYAGAGLAVLFFTYLWQSVRKFKGDKGVLKQKVIMTLLFCIVFFMIIPAVIYSLSYIPFIGYRPYHGLLDKVFDNMQMMYNYHSRLTATHPYQSSWYEWAYMKRPLYQAVTHGPDGKGSAISCFGNPLVWWPGLIAVLYLFKVWLWDKDKKAGFLCIAYSAQLIPWMFVTRNTFIYHYFPCSLFTILCSGYCISKLVKGFKHGREAAMIYGGIVVITFILFYPVISGQWVDESWARMWLKWLSGWTII